MTLTRHRATGILPNDYCLIPNTHIGYIFLPTFLDKTIPDQTRAALKKMTASAPLDGLIIDNRMNGGGLGSVAQAIMGLFASGLRGYFVSRDKRNALQLKPEDVGVRRKCHWWCWWTWILSLTEKSSAACCALWVAPKS